MTATSSHKFRSSCTLGLTTFRHLFRSANPPTQSMTRALTWDHPPPACSASNAQIQPVFSPQSTQICPTTTLPLVGPVLLALGTQPATPITQTEPVTSAPILTLATMKDLLTEFRSLRQEVSNLKQQVQTLTHWPGTYRTNMRPAAWPPRLYGGDAIQD